MRLLRYPMSTALTVAVALAQIGEFSFIVATLGNQLGILSVEATNTIVGASIVSIILNPVLYRALESWSGRATARTTAVEHELLEPMAAPLSADHRAVIVGYGPIGRAVTRLLRDNEIAPTVVEMNIDTMRELRAEGIDAVHGDATRPDVLAAARVGQAGSFIVSAAGVADAAESFRITRLQNPRVQILARATHLREVAALRAAGADFVVSGEGEVALAFTTSILQRLGATPDQIDRERDRVRSELADRG